MISIGKGSYGKVFLDKDNSVAIKEMYFDNCNITHDILKEVDILRRFSHHPNIILLQKIKVFKNKIWLLMDYGGTTLFSYTRDTNENERIKNCVPIFSQILSGLHFLHSNGIMHRDLKPENILVDHKLKVRICDFGLSKITNLNENTPKVCSLYYRPPECLFKSRKYNEKIDVWSFGCIMYEYLTQYVIFKGRSRKGMISKIFEFTEWRNYFCQTFQCDKKEYPIPERTTRRKQVLGRLPEKYQKFLIYILQVDPSLRPSIRSICKSDLFKNTCKLYNIKANKASEITDYLEKLNNKNDLLNNRISIINFIFDLADDKEYQNETPFMAIDLMDRYLSKKIKHLDYSIDEIAVACLRLASKFTEIEYSLFHDLAPDDLDDFEDQMCIIEKDILNTLKWIVHRDTVYSILKLKHRNTNSALNSAKKMVLNYDFIKNKSEYINEALSHDHLED